MTKRQLPKEHIPLTQYKHKVSSTDKSVNQEISSQQQTLSNDYFESQKVGIPQSSTTYSYDPLQNFTQRENPPRNFKKQTIRRGQDLNDSKNVKINSLSNNLNSKQNLRKIGLMDANDFKLSVGNLGASQKFASTRKLDPKGASFTPKIANSNTNQSLKANGDDFTQLSSKNTANYQKKNQPNFQKLAISRTKSFQNEISLEKNPTSDQFKFKGNQTTKNQVSVKNNGSVIPVNFKSPAQQLRDALLHPDPQKQTKSSSFHQQYVGQKFEQNPRLAAPPMIQSDIAKSNGKLAKKDAQKYVIQKNSDKINQKTTTVQRVTTDLLSQESETTPADSHSNLRIEKEKKLEDARSESPQSSPLRLRLINSPTPKQHKKRRILPYQENQMDFQSIRKMAENLTQKPGEDEQVSNFKSSFAPVLIDEPKINQRGENQREKERQSKLDRKSNSFLGNFLEQNSLIQVVRKHASSIILSVSAQKSEDQSEVQDFYDQNPQTIQVEEFRETVQPNPDLFQGNTRQLQMKKNDGQMSKTKKGQGFDFDNFNDALILQKARTKTFTGAKESQKQEFRVSNLARNLVQNDQEYQTIFTNETSKERNKRDEKIIIQTKSVNLQQSLLQCEQQAQIQTRNKTYSTNQMVTTTSMGEGREDNLSKNEERKIIVADGRVEDSKKVKASQKFKKPLSSSCLLSTRSQSSRPPQKGAPKFVVNPLSSNNKQIPFSKGIRTSFKQNVNLDKQASQPQQFKIKDSHPITSSKSTYDTQKKVQYKLNQFKPVKGQQIQSQIGKRQEKHLHTQRLQNTQFGQRIQPNIGFFGIKSPSGRLMRTQTSSFMPQKLSKQSLNDQKVSKKSENYSTGGDQSVQLQLRGKQENVCVVMQQQEAKLDDLEEFEQKKRNTKRVQMPIPDETPSSVRKDTNFQILPQLNGQGVITDHFQLKSPLLVDNGKSSDIDQISHFDTEKQNFRKESSNDNEQNVLDNLDPFKQTSFHRKSCTELIEPREVAEMLQSMMEGDLDLNRHSPVQTLSQFGEDQHQICEQSQLITTSGPRYNYTNDSLEENFRNKNDEEHNIDEIEMVGESTGVLSHPIVTKSEASSVQNKTSEKKLNLDKEKGSNLRQKHGGIIDYESQNLWGRKASQQKQVVGEQTNKKALMVFGQDQSEIYNEHDSNFKKQIKGSSMDQSQNQIFKDQQLRSAKHFETNSYGAKADLDFPQIVKNSSKDYSSVNSLNDQQELGAQFLNQPFSNQQNDLGRQESNTNERMSSNPKSEGKKFTLKQVLENKSSKNLFLTRSTSVRPQINQISPLKHFFDANYDSILRESQVQGKYDKQDAGGTGNKNQTIVQNQSNQEEQMTDADLSASQSTNLQSSLRNLYKVATDQAFKIGEGFVRQIAAPTFQSKDDRQAKSDKFTTNSQLNQSNLTPLQTKDHQVRGDRKKQISAFQIESARLTTEVDILETHEINVEADFDMIDMCERPKQNVKLDYKNNPNLSSQACQGQEVKDQTESTLTLQQMNRTEHDRSYKEQEVEEQADIVDNRRNKAGHDSSSGSGHFMRRYESVHSLMRGGVGVQLLSSSSYFSQNHQTRLLPAKDDNIGNIISSNANSTNTTTKPYVKRYRGPPYNKKQVSNQNSNQLQGDDQDDDIVQTSSANFGNRGESCAQTIDLDFQKPMNFHQSNSKSGILYDENDTNLSQLIDLEAGSSSSEQRIQAMQASYRYRRSLSNRRSTQFGSQSLLSRQLNSKKDFEPLLPQQSNELIGRMTLVLDLDETLVYFQQKRQVFYLRPHCMSFLQKMSNLFEVVIFTAAHEEYANRILDKLDPQKRYIAHRLYRQHTIGQRGVSIKDLSLLGRPLATTLIIDNLKENFRRQTANGIEIGTWLGDPKDTQLKVMEHFLSKLAFDRPADIRSHLRQFKAVFNPKETHHTPHTYNNVVY